MNILYLIYRLSQILQQNLNYCSVDNLMDLLCYISSLLVVWDWDSCSAQTGLRLPWQWQLAAVAITAVWLNLLSLIRKLPFIGIYVGKKLNH